MRKITQQIVRPEAVTDFEAAKGVDTFSCDLEQLGFFSL